MTPAATGADLDHGQERPERLPEGARVVVKVGSSSLTRADGGLDLNRIDILAGLIAGMRSRGHDVVLVSSGAVASGLVPLGLSRRPDELSLLQAAASVGQGRLAARWETAMSAYGLVTADVLVLLTDVDGLWTARPGTPGATPIRHVRSSADLAGVSVSGRGSFVGTGGMTTKLQAATIACASGTTTLIARADDAAALLGQEQVPADLGTWFEPTGPHRPSRRLWMAHASQPDGRVLIDAGAARALTVGKKSLLLPGLTGLDGDFESGSVVDVVGPGGVLARGICRYAAAELREVLAARAEGAPAPDHVAPVIHRDDLAELPRIAGV